MVTGHPNCTVYLCVSALLSGIFCQSIQLQPFQTTYIISSSSGIALVGNPEFAIVDEAYPYIARRLLTDDSPRLREALRYMVYGRSGVFDAGGRISDTGRAHSILTN
jgi:hypothetical protein